MRVATYQAVSGAGRAGLDTLADEEAGKPPNGTFAAPILHNVVPQVGSFSGVGNNGEEDKVAAETRKTLNRPDLHVAATCVRVPVRRAHSEAVFFETERADERSRNSAMRLAGAPGVVFHDRGIVTPLDVENTDVVHVARLRPETEDDGSHFMMWVVGDQLRKGAATNGVQILELLIEQGRFAAVAAMSVVVQKFGGSSVSTPELREIAASRVLEASRGGAQVVVVVSAMGRQPDPYATDTLLGLIGPVRGGPNRDLLLAVGEMISAAVFAELLTSLGAPAQAMTGGQAGILTDDTYGDARILKVDHDARAPALDAGIIPVVTGFQGATRERRRLDARPRRQRSDRDRARRRVGRRVGRHLHRRQRRLHRRSAPRRRRALRSIA